MKWVVGFVAALAAGCLAGCVKQGSSAGLASPLAQAIETAGSDQGSRLKQLLDSGMSPDTPIYRWRGDRVGAKPLAIAMDRGSTVAAKILIARGAKPPSLTEVGESTLCRATRMDLDLARMMVDAGLDPNGDGNRGSPLHVLAEGAPYDNLDGVYASQAEFDRRKAESKQSRKRRRIEFAEWLISKGARVDAIGVNHETPLCAAARFKEDVGFLEYLIKKGADVDAPDVGGPGGPLRAAALSFNRPAVAALLKAGAVQHPGDKRYKRLVDEVGDIAALLKRHGAKDAK